MGEGILAKVLLLLVGRDSLERSLSWGVKEYMMWSTNFHPCWNVDTPGAEG